jgi:cyclic dehypoxanthinyl futalosine synthase
LTLDEMRDAISSLGFVPRQRDVHYQLIDEVRSDFAVEANRKWVAAKKNQTNAVYQLA